MLSNLLLKLLHIPLRAYVINKILILIKNILINNCITIILYMNQLLFSLKDFKIIIELNSYINDLMIK
jgi:hypothetical protein